MEELIGKLPLLQRFSPNRGWYRWMYHPFSDKPWGPYPTHEAAFMGGDPIPSQMVLYRLRMPAGCYDIRKHVNSWE